MCPPVVPATLTMAVIIGLVVRLVGRTRAVRRPFKWDRAAIQAGLPDNAGIWREDPASNAAWNQPRLGLEPHMALSAPPNATVPV